MGGKPNLPDDLQMQIKVKLAWAVGAEKAISKEDLSMAIFGKYTPTTDRQIREAISLLQNGQNKHGEEIPVEIIVADLVNGGYFYAQTDTEFELYMADNQSRIDRLVEKRTSMYQRWYKGKKVKPSGLQERMF